MSISQERPSEREELGMTEEEYNDFLVEIQMEQEREWYTAKQEHEAREQRRVEALIMEENEEVGELEKWSEKHFGELAFWRTIAAGVNIVLSTIVIAKLFGWI